MSNRDMGRSNRSETHRKPVVDNDGGPTKVHPGGRPRKFAEPSRAITLTLPESTLRDLEKVDTDRARAIVKLAGQALAGRKGAATVDIVQVATNVGLVIVGSARALRKIPFLHLVEVAPSRFLLALKPGNDFRSLEIAINDLLEDLPEAEQDEKALLAKLVDSIKEMRKSDRVTMAEILLVSL
jgi:hypothetical protein